MKNQISKNQIEEYKQNLVNNLNKSYLSAEENEALQAFIDDINNITSNLD